MVLRVDQRYIPSGAPNAVFPFLAPATTARNIVDLNILCLVQNAMAATTNTYGLHRLYVTLAMEDTYVHLTSAKVGNYLDIL